MELAFHFFQCLTTQVLHQLVCVILHLVSIPTFQDCLVLVVCLFKKKSLV